MIELLNTYTDKDERYNIKAIPVTMSKFGPSGSLKSEKNTFEKTKAVTTNINNEIVFDLKYIFLIILESLQTEYLA